MKIPEIGTLEYKASLLLDGEELFKICEENVYCAKMCNMYYGRRIIIYNDMYEQQGTISYTKFVTNKDFINWNFK